MDIEIDEHALNEAGWKLVHILDKHNDPLHFNNIKSTLREVVECYLSKLERK